MLLSLFNAADAGIFILPFINERRYHKGTLNIAKKII